VADPALVRSMALALPEARDESDDQGVVVTVGGKGFVWRYLVRKAPKKPRVPIPDCVAIRCDLARKEMLIEASPETFFDDEHYRGFPAVIVRLSRIEDVELKALLEAAWRLRAPKSLLKRYNL
jgi:hypothetical protein